MIKVLTAPQMKSVDNKAIKEYEISGIILMENAGKEVFEFVLDIIHQEKIDNPKVVILCGKGNNGGDGFVLARHLITSNINTSVFSLGKEVDLNGDALISYKATKHLTEINYIDNIEEAKLTSHIKNADIIIDAILGTGLFSEIKGNAKYLVENVNKYSNGIIISVDIPTGINANTAKIMGNAICADYTVCFESPKIGNILFPALEHNGEVIISSISMPTKIITDNPEHNINLITEDYIKQNLPARYANSNKGTYGKTFNIVGSKLMPGAGYLSSISALKSGSGYSIVCCPDELVKTYAELTPDLIYKPYPDDCLSDSYTNSILHESQLADVITIGCGIGTAPKTIEFVQSFIKNKTSETPLIIDADGLNCISTLKEFTLPPNTIITPHPLELARLLKEPVSNILDDIISSARKASKLLNCIVVLKGAITIIAEQNGSIYINSTGNNALATAGTGDVLTGIIAGLLAQTNKTLIASILGIYLHGLAGDIYSEQKNQYSLTASELINFIPNAIKSVC